MANNTQIIDFHKIIIDILQDEFTDFYIGDYEKIQEKIPIPAIFINLAEFEKVETISGTGINPFFASCHFEAFICLSTFEDSSKVKIREEALRLSSFIDKNRFNNQLFMPAKFKLAQPDEFNPKFDGVEVWRVEWEQIITFIKS